MNLDDAAALAQVRHSMASGIGSTHKELNFSSKVKYSLQPIVFAPLSNTLLRNH
ncbi:hypothetical protein ACOJBM_21435 [Rhizobium beringeri]|jgi:hypothetical protein|uniref:hypothetical protein n=1 Tax=Rhizobium TaxID=379 RepID=UPI0013E3D926|nr:MULTISPECIES: hypothetical protein [Rhizobium]UIJ80762.1 hypothetical protein LZK78_05350 [Rhizobium leguminosarum]WSG75176.1 hypothetical protein U8P80_05460 [Rhizobium beringeri]WSH15371.1 hypothetical protein U8P74_05460 [Rhizobium beringeri]WSH28193.1 hypothetical protein U8P75_05530 [Rhizobium beringeri]WSH81217.1 hypothetical protein U8P69_05495 [Rhizobium beringeri]